MLGCDPTAIKSAPIDGAPEAVVDTAARSSPTDTAARNSSGGADTADTAPSTDTGVPNTTEDATDEATLPEDTGPRIDDDAPIEPTPDYSVAGPWQAGVLTNSFSSDAATEHWVDVWYPATDFGTGPVEYYGGPTWILDGDGYRDATPDCTEPRPVMVHSHGSSSIRWELFPLMEHMASHGWIVVAPDHTGNTYYSTGTPWRTLMERRPRDIHATFDWVVRQSADPSGPLFGCVDESDGYVVSGYSFGGYTAYAVGGAEVNDAWGESYSGLHDERVTQVVTHAAWDGYRALVEGTADIRVPVLTIGGERDATVGTAYIGLHSHVRSTARALASFPEAGHYTPVPQYCEALLLGDGCGPMYMDPSIYLSTMKTSILAFLAHNRGRPDAWDQLVEHPSVEWETVRFEP